LTHIKHLWGSKADHKAPPTLISDCKLRPFCWCCSTSYGHVGRLHLLWWGWFL